ncbi:hypothetical protein GCM10025780_24110 [Frondihabitans cladoniiphilus]|uniref:Uncharacterized protein n=1 Tax=Frondihabitans cladoniiphilus TaxID=715785 RepID=A0ABP8W1Y9_9MICO
MPYERDTINEDMKILGQRGLILYDQRFGGASSAFMKGPGVDAWEAFNGARSAVIERRIDLRDVYLRWLYEEIEVHDRYPTRDDFLKSGLTYFGLPYTEQDVSKAATWLREGRFIEGQGTWGDDSPIHPTLTAKGLFTVENNRSVSDPAPSSAVTNTYTAHIHGSANVVQGGENVQQTLTNNAEWAVEATKMADAVDQSLPALGEEIQREVAAANEELRGELASESEPGRVRGIVKSMINSLGKGGAGALGGILATQLGTFLLSLPA